MKTMTIKMSQELVERLEALRKDEQSFDEVLAQVVGLGCYQLEYRKASNPKRAMEMKALRELRKRAQADPELAVRLGLGIRPVL